jgi:hypothetical protein
VSAARGCCRASRTRRGAGRVERNLGIDVGEAELEAFSSDFPPRRGRACRTSSRSSTRLEERRRPNDVAVRAYFCRDSSGTGSTSSSSATHRTTRMSPPGARRAGPRVGRSRRGHRHARNGHTAARRRRRCSAASGPSRRGRAARHRPSEVHAFNSSHAIMVTGPPTGARVSEPHAPSADNQSDSSRARP